MIKAKNRFLSTAVVLYISYIMMGLRLSMLAQYKPQFSNLWHTDVAGVLQVVAAIGLGGIISILITGPISDFFGRKVCGVIGHLIWAGYFIGLLYAPNLTVAYIIGTIAGIGQSFVNSSNFPALMEIFPKKSSVAGLMSKFAINVGQFALPVMAFVASLLGANYRGVFMTSGIIYLALAALLSILPYPKAGVSEDTKQKLPSKRARLKDIHLTPGIVALSLIGYTATAVFLLWVNTYQELAKGLGMSDPINLQSIYAIGAAIAVLFNSFIINKGVKEVDILIVFPLLTVAGLLLPIIFKEQWTLYAASLAVGFFAASGLYQVALTVLGNSYPEIKATVQSWAAFFSALSNLTIFTLAAWITSWAGANASVDIVWMNIIISLIGTILAIIVKVDGKNNKNN